ncbi:unnamed protein product [Nippostrongylus brasiliensis]|uniref:Secreted protein n=1 Tax=Nippostrongylus brasiliensis TaxID=27835 RepID=A0A0N4XYP2_NIPBR|nr:unnamed protein product [Nippostrongylus brasiliensis]
MWRLNGNPTRPAFTVAFAALFVVLSTAAVTRAILQMQSKMHTLEQEPLATTKGDGDTGALGLFYKCPGRQHQKDFAFCSVGEKMFKDMIPSAVETMGHLRLDTVFSLARPI